MMFAKTAVKEKAIFFHFHGEHFSTVFNGISVKKAIQVYK